MEKCLVPLITDMGSVKISQQKKNEGENTVVFVDVTQKKRGLQILKTSSTFSAVLSLEHCWSTGADVANA